MKFYVIAGEASGDLHGSNLMKAMLAKEPGTEFRFWGGDRMAVIAGQPVKHIRDLAFMGFIEVLANLRTIMANIKLCKTDILKYKPDAIILIDYPGFNLRIAEFANENNIPVHYYISPQVWAWKQNRVFKIRNIVDEMYCILPFEKDFYKKFEMDVHYVGHPLLDAIEEFKKSALSKTEFTSKYHLRDKKILALLPGSRRQEISIKLPIMLKAAQAFPEYDVLVAGAPNIPPEFYQKLAAKQIIHLIQNDTYNLLNNAHLAMVTSGTATLETALFKVPEVVCYKGSNISYQIAKRLIKVKYISLVNLIMDKLVVKELIQHELNPENIIHELKNLKDEQHTAYTNLMQNYDSLAEVLGGGGASKRTAELILNYTKQ
ncbi:MAG: lipid-A-disaccharide synthase [Crocinitomicaceae bacterium]|nr:lipid-A-disaccharide synthase [Crocinitomicaceae bacterium]MBK8926161.1 lipid-A-disaccharide synthase [Crocinitomicaceae bacterium]